MLSFFDYEVSEGFSSALFWKMQEGKEANKRNGIGKITSNYASPLDYEVFNLTLNSCSKNESLSMNILF